MSCSPSAGIGAQERALRSLGVPYEITHTCDCDKDAVLSYAAMRFNLEEEMKTFDFPSKEQMIEELQTKNLGFDFEHKHVHTINMRMNEDEVKKYYLADKLSKNLGDISQVNKLPYSDIWTYSFPCTDLSVAGKGEGMVNKCECGYSWPIDFSDSNDALICPECGRTVSRSTRSGLLGQVQRLLSVAKSENTLPRYLLLENVKNLVGKKFKSQFDAWVNWLDSIGYSTYYKVLNAKNYSIPQNRERVFAISIRKDVDTNGFTFPEPIPLTTRLKDILETSVDEKYYLSDSVIEKIKDKISIPLKRGYLVDVSSEEPDTTEIDPLGNYSKSDYNATPIVNQNGIAPTVRENHGQVTAILERSIAEEQEPFIVASRGRNPENPSDRTTGAPTEQRLEPNLNGTTNCLTSVAKDNYVCEPQVLRAERTEYGKAIRKQYEAGEIDEKIGNMREMKPRTDGVSNTITTLLKDNYVAEPEVHQIANVMPGTNRSNPNQGRVYNTDGLAPTLTKMDGGNRQPMVVDYIRWRIRKLTEKECWRLMGFTDKDHDRAAQYTSASARYKQAGNSICTSCLVALFSSLLLKDGYKSEVWSKYLIDFNS